MKEANREIEFQRMREGDRGRERERERERERNGMRMREIVNGNFLDHLQSIPNIIFIFVKQRKQETLFCFFSSCLISVYFKKILQEIMNEKIKQWISTTSVKHVYSQHFCRQ